MKRILHLIACIGFAAAAASSHAQFPSKPITLVAPFPPGGTSDSLARFLGQDARERIRGSARREGCDQGDRLAGELGVAARRGRGESDTGNQVQDALHDEVSGVIGMGESGYGESGYG